jgi:uncharacterized protein
MNIETKPYIGANAAAYDEGLRSHFRKVYNLIALSLVITGATAYAVSNIPALTSLLFGTPLKWVVMFLPMIFVFVGFSPKALATKTVTQLRTTFYAFAAVFGMCLATVFLVFSGADIARAFFVTSATFAAMSLIGYTTKRDLSKLGSFAMMGAIGLVIAMVVNIFLQSDLMQFVISALGVLVYTIMTAFDTQNIKESYSSSYGEEANAKAGIMGALSLYMNFIMLFQFILSLMSNRE